MLRTRSLILVVARVAFATAIVAAKVVATVIDATAIFMVLPPLLVMLLLLKEFRISCARCE